MTIFTATYSPEDNKLRLYASERLDKELYAKVRELGFIYAPKQGLFVAPMWTPERRDFLLSLVDEIEDEALSLEERASERAARFEVYSDKRKSDAKSYGNHAKSLADQVPMGQPILVGHHSEKRARKHAEKIDKAMQKAVKNWDQSEYWAHRAKRVIKHQQFKESPDLRLRRIKRIEADKRKQERRIKESEKFIKLWNEAANTYENALKIANYDSTNWKKHEQFDHYRSVWDGLDKKELDEKTAKELCLAKHDRIIKRCNEWINHYQLRIEYEKEMLKADGHNPEPEKPKRAKQLPLVNYPADGIIEVTKEQYAKIPKDYKGTRKVAAKDGKAAHRVRIAMDRSLGLDSWGMSVVFIKDQKQVDVPEIQED